MRRFFAKPPPPPPPDPIAALRDLRATSTPFAPGEIAPGVTLHHDPDARITGQWSSPAGRMIELETQVTQPGLWCALHFALPDPALPGRYFGVVARTAAPEAVVTKVCLRSGTDDGFTDHFFPRQILSQAEPSDHHDLIVPSELPMIPTQAPWREVILFLPPNRGLIWALHDLRLIAA